MDNNNPKENKKNGSVSQEICDLVIVGEASVGKSSILCQYIDAKFNQNIISTNGIDLCIKNENINGVPCMP